MVIKCSFIYNEIKRILSMVGNHLGFIMDLIEYRELAHNPYSELQSITKAYNIINATGTFKDGIKTWNRITDPLGKIWITFRTHFRTAHEELAETGDLTLHQTGYHQANLVDEIVNRLQAEQASQETTRIEDTLQQLVNTAISTPGPTSDR